MTAVAIAAFTLSALLSFAWLRRRLSVITFHDSQLVSYLQAGDRVDVSGIRGRIVWRNVAAARMVVFTLRNPREPVTPIPAWYVRRARLEKP